MKSGRVEFNSYNSSKELVYDFSKKIASNLKSAIKNSSRATLIVSGGNTPKELFKELRKVDIDWSRVTVGLCDERWVDRESKDSNESLVKRYLLKDRAKEATFVGLYFEDRDPKDVESLCCDRINSLLPIDVLILGMGVDGHIASLFPNSDRLMEAYDLNSKRCCISIEAQNVKYTRMSLNLNTILSAKNLYLYFEGERKLEVYKRALSIDDRFNLPVGAVLHQDIKDIEVYYAK